MTDDLPVRKVYARVENIAPVTTLRYVLWSESRGVYLGGNVWSKDEAAKTKNFAPTFENGIKLEMDYPSDVEPRECFSDLAGHNASKDAVANAGLPRW